MNKQECDILKALLVEPFMNQRALSESTGHSLGVINRSINSLIENQYLDQHTQLTLKARKKIESYSPQRAIILAAGFGMRMVPINNITPKGLLEVKGEPLVERLIKQLHEVGTYDISIVVGFMKECYEYLIDEYQVKLVVNTEYSSKNNLHSIRKVMDQLSNTYIIPCDIWCRKNPFHQYELYSWYMVSDQKSESSSIRVNRKMELVDVQRDKGNTMIGICYLNRKDSKFVKDNINKLCLISKYDHSFWEEALYDKNKMIPYANMVSSLDVMEINTYEDLRELDSNSEQLKNEAISIIANALHVGEGDITNIDVLKKGMTNRSFLFNCKNKKYIMRIPGEGTDQLINRREEADVYHVIADKNICDDISYMNPDNGYKITRYFQQTRTCDPENLEDVRKCMKRLRDFHEMKLIVGHEFDIFKQIEFYESLWDNHKSIYKDYLNTKENIFRLKKYIDKQVREKVLTHIDAVPDNFLFVMKNGKEEIRLIDWEYAGMQDPHIDIAMFAIYAMYDKKQIDQLIDLYFTEGCSKDNRMKIYCYVAVCGLLWSNWCEYKRNLGVEFGEYSLRQYRYAREFYCYVVDEINDLEE